MLFSNPVVGEGVEEEERDRLYVSLAAALSKGQLDLAAVQQQLDKFDLKRWAQAEDVKIQLRGALMSVQLFHDDSGVCNALVAREVAIRCRDRDIFYGMEFGSADAVAAADYVTAVLLLRLGRPEDAIPRLTELAQISVDQEDSKGGVEAFAIAGEVTFALKDYATAAIYFEQAIEVAASLPPDDELAFTFSTQEMVREDNKNVFNFDSNRIVPPIIGSTALLCFLLERLASSRLQANRFTEAMEASSRSLKLWRDHLQVNDSAAGLRVLFTHALLLAIQSDIPAARAILHEMSSLETKLALPAERRLADSLLTRLTGEIRS